MGNGNKNLGRQIKDYRLSRQWTQKTMANHLEISRATYLRIENGKGCSDLTRAKIAKILGEVLQAA